MSHSKILEVRTPTYEFRGDIVQPLTGNWCPLGCSLRKHIREKSHYRFLPCISQWDRLSPQVALTRHLPQRWSNLGGHTVALGQVISSEPQWLTLRQGWSHLLDTDIIRFNKTWFYLVKAWFLIMISIRWSQALIFSLSFKSDLEMSHILLENILSSSYIVLNKF